MIEHLTGTLLHKETDRVVVEAGGVGYGLEVTPAVSESLGAVGSPVRLWVWTHVREDALLLFGFRSRAERGVFEVLIEISGVGPKLALAVLSYFSIEQLVQVIMKEDAQTLKKVPGVGLKKAEKLLLELKGKVARLSQGIEPARLDKLRAESPKTGGALAGASREAREALAALLSLETPPVAAERAVAKALEILGPSAPTEELVREALRHRHVF